jgi:Zn finger protein HypA/HybF involved in hydrogenase expression
MAPVTDCKCSGCGKIFAASRPTVCKHCGSSKIHMVTHEEILIKTLESFGTVRK